MSRGAAQNRPAPGLWRRFIAWLAAVFAGPRALLAAGLDDDSRRRWSELPEELRDLLGDLDDATGVVRDTVDRAVRDYLHLQDVLLEPGAAGSAVDDVVLLADASTLLRGLLESAPLVSALSTVAGERQDDRPGREAAGDAMLELRDRGRMLHNVASAALAWASSQSDENVKRLQECAARLAAGSSSP